MAFSEILQAVFGALEMAQIPYVVGGSLASSAWGEPRHTNDIDIAVKAAPAELARLAEKLGEDFNISGLDDPAEGEYHMAQLMYIPEVIRFDLFLVGDEPFSASELARAQKVELTAGVHGRCATAEDIIIQKLRWYELGNRVSDRQWNDIVRVIEVQQGRLDWDYLRKWAAHFRLSELLKEADSEALD